MSPVEGAVLAWRVTLGWLGRGLVRPKVGKKAPPQPRPRRDSCLKGELGRTVTVTSASVPDPFSIWLFLTQLLSEAPLLLSGVSSR